MQIIFNGIGNGALIALFAMAFVLVYLPWRMLCSLPNWRAER